MRSESFPASKSGDSIRPRADSAVRSAVPSGSNCELWLVGTGWTSKSVGSMGLQAKWGGFRVDFTGKPTRSRDEHRGAFNFG